MMAFAFSFTVPSAIAFVQAPAAAIDELADGGGGMRCRDCSSHEVCSSNGVCITSTTCGSWYNC